MLSLIASTTTLIFGAWIFSKCKRGCGFHLIAEQRLLFLGYFLATAGSGLVMLLLLATLNLARQGRLLVK
ncbi:hypothetical protein [Neisseria flavescens]|uniref:hypothetical protein n=1 Tax=Neisseria flavescens TaxID=484 RepID=UPI000A8D5351|nr:hypothetical protein [Neisseria flavescens]